MSNVTVKLSLNPGNSQTIIAQAESDSSAQVFWSTSKTADFNEKPSVLSVSKTNIDMMGNIIR